MPATDRSQFLSSLDQGPILLDAAMGTRLIARGLDLARDDPSLWVLDQPETVLEIHWLDVQAGSQAITTNTFGANRSWLDRFGRANDVRVINQRAVEIARIAVGPDRFVLGSIGPTASDHPVALREQAEALFGAGVDALILETHRLDQALEALGTLQDSPSPILASLFDWPDPVDRSASQLIERGALAIGANCLPGMAQALALARKLRGATTSPILIKPSARWPVEAFEPPEAFEAAVPELIALGVRLIGGCCGSTEAHVRALRLGLSRSASGIMDSPIQ